MIWLKNITLISAIIGFTGYLIQILMLIGCCDKYIKFQVNLFRITFIAMVIAFVSYCITLVIK